MNTNILQIGWRYDCPKLGYYYMVVLTMDTKTKACVLVMVPSWIPTILTMEIKCEIVDALAYRLMNALEVLKENGVLV